MTKLIEDLKAAGWVETTLGECRPGEEVLLPKDGPFPQAMQVIQPAEWGGEKGPLVNTSDGRTHLATFPVLRAPRPEYKPGTVALITWDGQDKPMRAMRLNEDWVVVDNGYVLEGSAEVVRVLLPADQDTPTVEVTDEMVERAAEAMYRQEFGSGWDDYPTEGEKDNFREWAREVIEAALGVEKEK